MFESTQNWAVKYRPRILEDLVGQDNVVSEITGMLKRKQIASTWLVSGAPGNGKTTIARIIAKLINGFDPEKDYYADITEINAGDERGIDSIRNLVASLKFMPQEGQFKVIILDEAHQLTSQAASALLKPTEEPPPHVIWMFVTSEPSKLLDTIRGRSYKVMLDRVQPEHLIKLLRRICKIEEVFLPTKKYLPLLQMVAETVGGQPREGLSLLHGLANKNADTPIDIDVDPKEIRASIKQIMKGMDVGADKVAALILLSLYAGKDRAVSAISDTNDFMGLSYQLLDLNGFLIESHFGTPGWSSYTRSLLKGHLEKQGVTPSHAMMTMTHELLITLRQQLMMTGTEPRHAMLYSISNLLIQHKRAIAAKESSRRD